MKKSDRLERIFRKILDLEVEARPNVPVSYGHRTLADIRDLAKQGLVILPLTKAQEVAA